MGEGVKVGDEEIEEEDLIGPMRTGASGDSEGGEGGEGPGGPGAGGTGDDTGEGDPAGPGEPTGDDPGFDVESMTEEGMRGMVQAQMDKAGMATYGPADPNAEPGGEAGGQGGEGGDGGNGGITGIKIPEAEAASEARENIKGGTQSRRRRRNLLLEEEGGLLQQSSPIKRRSLFGT